MRKLSLTLMILICFFVVSVQAQVLNPYRYVTGDNQAEFQNNINTEWENGYEIIPGVFKDSWDKPYVIMKLREPSPKEMEIELPDEDEDGLGEKYIVVTSYPDFEKNINYHGGRGYVVIPGFYKDYYGEPKVIMQFKKQ